MTFPVATVNTVPKCGACGRSTFGRWAHEDLNSDLICDGCGADLLAYGWTTGVIPPLNLVVQGDTPTNLSSTATWTDNPNADTTDMRWRFREFGLPTQTPWITVSPATSPTVFGPTPGLGVVEVEVRSVHLGVAGPWSAPVFAAVTP
jgi:hypothetical protein